MKLLYLPVRPDLRDYFGVYYVFAADKPVRQPMCAELGNIRFVVRGGGEIHWPDNRTCSFPEMSLVGPTMSAYTFSARPDTLVFGVGVLPRGWDALLGFGANELLDSLCDLRDCVDVRARLYSDTTLCALQHAKSFKECATFVDNFLAAQISRRRNKIRDFPIALEEWLLRPDFQGLDDLIENMDVSRRQTDRIAKYYFGASPKALQRKYRTLHALTRMSLSENVDWHDEINTGFYDQSHFIKEFKTFVGATPKMFMANAGALMAQSIKMRARATHKPPLKML